MSSEILGELLRLVNEFTDARSCRIRTIVRCLAEGLLFRDHLIDFSLSLADNLDIGGGTLHLASPVTERSLAIGEFTDSHPSLTEFIEPLGKFLGIDPAVPENRENCLEVGAHPLDGIERRSVGLVFERFRDLPHILDEKVPDQAGPGLLETIGIFGLRFH